MSHEVSWNKIIVEEFVELAMLNPEEEMILRTRVANWSRVKQSCEFNMSLSKIDRIIRNLKRKYDEVQKYSVILPPRKTGDEVGETFEGFDSFLIKK